MIKHRNSTIITDLLKKPFKRQKKHIKKKKKKKKEKGKKTRKKKKEKKKEEEERKEYININESKSLKLLIKNIKINFPFYCISLICLYFLCKKTNHNYIFSVISFIFISGFGYFVHWCSHAIPWTELYEKQDNFFTKNRYTDEFVRCFLNFMEFHDITHHDSDINKSFKNIFLEAVNNSVTQGLLFVFAAIIIKQVDLWACILWALLYATFHNINYLFIKPDTHKNHHIDPTTNFGIDIWDIIFNTKYENEEPEDYNHYSINLILLTILLYYIIPKNSILNYNSI